MLTISTVSSHFELHVLLRLPQKGMSSTLGHLYSVLEHGLLRHNWQE